MFSVDYVDDYIITISLPVQQQTVFMFTVIVIGPGILFQPALRVVNCYSSAS
jgi:hypothetical protein